MMGRADCGPQRDLGFSKTDEDDKEFERNQKVRRGLRKAPRLKGNRKP